MIDVFVFASGFVVGIVGLFLLVFYLITKEASLGIAAAGLLAIGTSAIALSLLHGEGRDDRS